MATSNKTKKLQLLGGGFATKKQLEEQYLKTYVLDEGETVEDAPEWAEEVVDPFAESEGGEGSGSDISREEFDQLSDAIAELGNKKPQEYFLLKSPNGTIFKVKVTDTGTLEVIGEADIDLPDLIPGRLLLWNDEFDGDSLNTDIWDFELGYVRNNEKQYYTNDSKNAYVSDSILHLVALKDNPADGYEWSSASIDSQLFTNGTEGAVSGVQRDTGFSYGYGLIEIKARCLTPSSGVWPAFWSRGASQQSEGWPMCGEIDIGELFFNGAASTHHYNPGIFWYDWHYLLQKSQHATDDGLITGSTIYKTVDTDWHIYGMERSETAMIFYFDREEFCRIDLTALDDTDIQSAMGQPMSVKLNVAMGSTGGTIPEDLERAEFDIEYVRYYAPVNVTESTDSGTWDFPDYMPTELAPSKVARIIPERDMTNGKNQYLYWESSDSTKIDATAGLIRTKSGVSGDVTVTMKDTFGNSKSAIITIKDDANCISDEVREIPTNPTIMSYGETSNIQVRLVPYWVTNHTVTAVLDPAIDGVEVSVAESSHVIAKYSTPCSIINVTNNYTGSEDVSVKLVITAEDSGAELTLPITIKAEKVEFDTADMYAAYLYENTAESSPGIGTLADSTENAKDPITNIYYTASNNNGVCRIAGKGIQAQTQMAKFANNDEGFFLEEFKPDESRTFVFSVKAGMTEMRQQYNTMQAMLSIVHSGIGETTVSNTDDGRHGASFVFAYNSNTADAYPVSSTLNSGTFLKGFLYENTLDTATANIVSPENIINPETDNTAYLHSGGFDYNFVVTYNADDNSFGTYLIADGKFLAVLYNGLIYALTRANYDKGIFRATNTVFSETIISEAETDPFYWRYGNGNQKCSDFVRAICVYDKVLSIDEMREVAAKLTAHYAE